MKKDILKDFIFIVFGTIFLAIGINLFLAPNKISGGGVTGIATVLLHFFGIKISVTNLFINAVLFLFGYRLLGKFAIIKTVLGTLSLTVFLEIVNIFTPYTDDLFVSAIAGGILMGAGIGLVIRQGASTGGSDFFALMIKRKFPHISVAMLILFIDFAIIILSGFVFKSITLAVYSFSALFIASKLAEFIERVGDRAKTLYIMSFKNEEISKMIMENWGRGVTGILAEGMYSKKETKMLMSVVSPKQVPEIVREIKRIDDGAFIVISDAREIVGNFLSEKNIKKGRKK